MTSVKTNDLITLAQWMAGDFSNYKQSFEKPQLFAHIHIFFRPLPWEFFNAIGFYSEQVYDHDLWTPYRQGVHKLIDRGEQIYIENYSLNDPVQYAGAARELSILKTITPDCIQRRYNCSMVFKREGEMFRGSVEPGNQCLIEKKGCSTYLISDVEITATTWSSLDRGMDANTHQQIWGSDFGSLWFEKRQSFAGELPPL
ncbi:MAG: chromophore lyase CpcT/CpeT [Microcoleus sp. PH2017_16_JOR_D_A]|uniref:chromophore lyase CpcT/CpeT n=1 Tax=Microcoleus sp. PH2017_16_JOR_D_A TaxID=2798827 RepID=UPI001D3E7982|nr:chromophore lyase CpcT/CpeT [Microcoleus sp. PH2017_16_JOR_D_A]MCC3492474.1 chromophore lyase CpcT/CpeT [Microcoleus sp. PH2017_16_JOR_D_A]